MPRVIPEAYVNRYRQLWCKEHLLGAARAQVTEAHAQLQQEILNAVKPRGPGQVHPIEKRKDLSLSEYKRVYLRQGIPVILQGAARQWPCVQHWNPQWLADRYGSDPLTLIDAAPSDLNAIDYQMRHTTLGELIREMDQKPLEKYSRFNRLLYDHPELAEDFDRHWLKQRRNLLCSGQTFQVFIGGKSSKTHLHAAAEHNLFTQVYGRKHWILYPPEYDCVLRPPVNRTPYFHSAYNPDAPDPENFPALQYLDRYEGVLEPGDILFNPPSWWHHVTNLTGSIGVGFRWFAAGDAFRLDWGQALLTLLATNPPIWAAMQHRTDFARIFSYMHHRQK
ncbi:MAG: cupin-like domain-containing protein [Candidatus Sericytochromatia bacterium]|nr:cupin-like domain-containing protein [Candidatus Sericytochromatia bacterium]